MVPPQKKVYQYIIMSSWYIIIYLESILLESLGILNGLVEGNILTGNQPDFPMKDGIFLKLFPLNQSIDILQGQIHIPLRCVGPISV